MLFHIVHLKGQNFAEISHIDVQDQDADWYLHIEKQVAIGTYSLKFILFLTDLYPISLYTTLDITIM